MGERPIFIVGAPRSGTTLLRDLLRAHPRLSFPPESRYLDLWYRVHGDPVSDDEALRLAQDLLRSTSIASWGLGATPARLAHHRTFAGMVTALFEEYAGREGKPRWGDKTPTYARDLQLFARLWPRGQFVHIIRDGRDVACSYRDRRWPLRDAYGIGERWAATVAPACRDGAALGPGRYHALRYEDLVRDTEAELRAVCAFIEEEYSPALLAPRRRGSAALAPGRSGYESAVRTASVGRWRTRLTADDQALFAAAAGDLLEELGYPDVGPRRRPTALELRRWRVERRARFVRARLTAADRVPLTRQTLRMWRARIARRVTPARARAGG